MDIISNDPSQTMAPPPPPSSQQPPLIGVSVRMLHIPKLPNGSCGFHLSRSKWDPYPWVSRVDSESPAELTGLKNGDCVLEVNGEDILGLRITEVANIVRTKPDYVSLLLWSTGINPNCDPETLCCGPMPLNLERLSMAVAKILGALECPVCLDTIPPPVMHCQNGHLVCAKCRSRSEKCPVCREKYFTRRSLIAEQVLNAITSSFNLSDDDGKVRERLFGAKCMKKEKGKINEMNDVKPIKSHTHSLLAKLMGKASSVDNLTSANKNKEVHLGVNNSTNMIKAKSLSLSLSASEIFSPTTAISIVRCPSSGSQILGLSSSQGDGLFVQSNRRPTSCNVSTENLSNRDAAIGGVDGNSNNNCDDVIQIPVPLRIPEFSYLCPCGGGGCPKLPGNKINQHITEMHKVPIISFGTESAEISLPPRIPIENACLILILDGQQFWLKLIVNS